MKGRLRAVAAIELGFRPHWSQPMDKKFFNRLTSHTWRVGILPGVLLNIQEVWEVTPCISVYSDNCYAFTYRVRQCSSTPRSWI